ASLPHLDSVVHETLRMHLTPPLTSFTYAMEDDTLPLAAPIVIKSGETVNNLFVAKGSILTAPLQNLNISEEFFTPRGSE
ncbi:hypothetical protein EDD85DRAFT_736203, partial [Armillaria nabsnona]